MKETSNWWEEFFSNDFADVTLTSEKDICTATKFIGSCVSLDKNSRIYEPCCGKGLLSYQLAQRYKSDVVGLDIINKYIEHANINYATKVDRLSYVLGDASKTVFEDKFDLVINWHTSFAYSANDDDNLRTLMTITNNLKQRGKIIINTINPFAIFKNFSPIFVNTVDIGNKKTITIIRENHLNSLHTISSSDWTVIYPDGSKKFSCGQTRLYTLFEFKMLLEKAGIVIDNVYGSEDFSVYHNDNSPSPRMIIIGTKL